MAILQVDHDVQETSSVGFSKGIEKSSEVSIRKYLQSSQYLKPYSSAIRELASNALDAIREKDIALKILGGEPESKYYLRLDDEEHRDSNFDEDYYDPKWLWTTKRYHVFDGSDAFRVQGRNPETVYITYEEGGPTGKDRVIIEDYGVGLGKKRLYKYFTLGYSSKRNTPELLGKFGFGAKAAFATGVDNYTVISRYNGMEFRFIAYMHTVDSIVPKLNTDTGEFNPHVIITTDEGQDVVINYIPTTMPNGVKLIIDDVKKHHKQQYIDGVKDQLLYLNGIEFGIRPHEGQYMVITTKADVVYEDETMVLSNGTRFSKPHILIDGINYGPIDFKELELEDKNGNIAVKLGATEVEVSSNRESVIWNDNTKPAILKAFNRVVDKAGEMVTRELEGGDFLSWIKACAGIGTRGWRSDQKNSSVIARLAQIIDLKRVSPAYKQDPRFHFGTIIHELLNLKVAQVDIVLENGKRVKRLQRVSTYLEKLNELPIVVRKNNVSIRKTKWLIDKVFQGPYLEIKLDEGNPPVFEMTQELKGIVLERMGLKPDKRVERVNRVDYTYEFDSVRNVTALSEYNDLFYKLLLASDGYTVFEEYDVPEDYVATEEHEETVSEEDTPVTKEELVAQTESAKARRKAQGKTVLFTPRSVTNLPSPSAVGVLPRVLESHKLEVPFSAIDTWKAEEIFFGNKEHESMIHTAAMITRVADKLAGLEVPRPVEITPYENSNGDGVTYYTTQRSASVPNPKFRKDQLLGVELHTWESYKQGTFHVVNKQNELASWFFQNDRIKLLQVSKENMKYYRDFKHIKQFFMDIHGKTLTMSDALIKWNTARLLHKRLHELRFLEGFDRFHRKYHTLYTALKNYTASYYREMEEHTDKFFGNSTQEYNSLTGYLDKVFDFQVYVTQNPGDTDGIATLAKKFFNPKEGVEIDNAVAIDMEIYNTFTELLDYAAPVKDLLNSIWALTREKLRDDNYGGIHPIPGISDELEKEVKFYLDSKQVTYD